MTVSGGLVTASGYAAMLDEPNQQVQLAALVEINKVRNTDLDPFDIHLDC
jgi:hypothetical protein